MTSFYKGLALNFSTTSTLYPGTYVCAKFRVFTPSTCGDIARMKMVEIWPQAVSGWRGGPAAAGLTRIFGWHILKTKFIQSKGRGQGPVTKCNDNQSKVGWVVWHIFGTILAKEVYGGIYFIVWSHSWKLKWRSGQGQVKKRLKFANFNQKGLDLDQFLLRNTMFSFSFTRDPKK